MTIAHVQPLGAPRDEESHLFALDFTALGCGGIHRGLEAALWLTAHPAYPGLVPPDRRRSVIKDFRGVTLGEVWNGLAICWVCGWFHYRPRG